MFFDVSLGKREAVDEGMATELVAPLLSSDEPVVGFRLTNKSYTLAGAKVVAHALASAASAGRFSSLTTVDIADIIAGRPEEEALEVLRTICAPLKGCKALASIDVSDNAFGAKGLDACVDLLEGQSNLVSLKAQNNGISAASAAQLCDIVLRSNGSQLRRFHFYNNMSGPEGAAAIASMLRDPKLSGLTDLRFSGTRAQSQGTLKVVEAIAGALKLLQRLDLNDNTFLLPGARCLSSTLKAGGFQHLASLLLRDGSLGAKGCACACVGLAANPPPCLTELDLSGNEVGEEGAPTAKAKALKALRLALLALSPTLQVFLCEDNELGSKAVSSLAPALASCGKLSRLQLCNNGVYGAAGALPLVKALVAGAAGGAAMPLLVNKSGGLELDGNCFTPEEVEAVEEVLAEGGFEGAVGSLDDNDDEADEEEEEEEEGIEDEDEEDGEGASGGSVNVGECGDEDDLVSALAALRVANPLPTPPLRAAAAAAGEAVLLPAAAGLSGSSEAMKRLVGYKAVDDYVGDGMVVGLGTGSTAFYAVERLGELLKLGQTQAEKGAKGGLRGVRAVPTSERTRLQAEALGIPLLTLDALACLVPGGGGGGCCVDVAIDGADSVEPPAKGSGAKAVLVKGGGGALLREKMVEANAATFVCIVDASKVCPGKLGPHFMVPIEVTPFAHKHTALALSKLPSVAASGGEAVLRRGSVSNNNEEPGAPLAVTDNGNHIVDLRFRTPLADPSLTAAEIAGVVGVVEHGLFVGMADVVLVANSDGTIDTLTHN